MSFVSLDNPNISKFLETLNLFSRMSNLSTDEIHYLLGLPVSGVVNSKRKNTVFHLSTVARFARLFNISIHEMLYSDFDKFLRKCLSQKKYYARIPTDISILDEVLKKRVSKAFKEYRIRNYMTQKDLSIRLGVTQTTISRIESKKTLPLFVTLVKFSEITGSFIDDVLFKD